MNQMSGMNVQRVYDMARAFTRSGADVDGVINRVTAELEALDWRGPDRDRIVREWTEVHVPRLRQTIQTLQIASNRATTEADDQARISSSQY